MRLPIEPFLDQFPGVPADTVLDRIGMSDDMLRRWRERGVTLDTADTIAVRSGRHPFDVWGNDWWAAQQRHLDRSALSEPWEDDGPVRADDYRVPSHRCATDGCDCRYLIRWRCERDRVRHARRIDRQQEAA